MSKHYASKVVAIALAEVGYKEKASNSQLDSKTANAGSANFNKYAAYIDKNAPSFYNFPKNGYDWCDIFNDYCHIKASDWETARKALYQPYKSCGAGCSFSADYFRQNGAFIKRGSGMPKPGDQIFFGPYGNEYHTGIVVEVTATTVTTVEGNSSEMVAKRTYALTYSEISGYGRPRYDKEEAAKLTLIDNGALYQSAYKDILGSASKVIKNLKKGDKVEFIEDDGWGWSRVKSGDKTGWIMNSHFKKDGLSAFKTYTLKEETSAAKIVQSKNAGTVKLKKGTKYSLICTIEDGKYKNCSYIAVGSARYYLGIKPAASSMTNSSSGMKISNDGVNLIKSFEGLSLKACKAIPSEQYYTIGYGHYGPDVKANQTITETEALALLKSDLAYFVNGVNSQLKIKVTQGQFDALVSFAYNCGLGGLQSSKIPEHLNSGKLFKACAQFPVHRHAGGAVLAGLQTRREKELRLFIKGCTFKLAAEMNARDGASTSKKVLKVLAKGSKVKVTDVKVIFKPSDSAIDIWCKAADGWICFKQGTVIYVS